MVKRSQTFLREEGMAMMTALIFLVAFGVLAALITTKVVSHARQVDSHVDFVNTYEGMEAGLAQALVEVQRIADVDLSVPPDERDGLVGVDPLYPFAASVPDFGDALVTPQMFNTMPNIEYFAYTFDWANDLTDNNGDGLVDTGPETFGYFSVYSVARANLNGNTMALRRSENIVQAVNVNVWQNAIFAGTGAGGGLINGNVAIHGSVHLLGDSLDPSDPAITAMDMSGTSLVHNNYQGLSADLLSRIPPLPTTIFNGETVETLNATLRVKRGMVSMSGSSEVGEADVFGNDYKETMDGVYVTDGWTGNDVDANGDPQSVYSDNGWDEAYDLGDAVPYPTYADDGGRDHLAHYLETDTDPNVGFQQVYTGDVTIQAGGDNFYWNATTGTEVLNGTPGDGNMPLDTALSSDEFYVWYDGDNDRLIINGRVAIDGNIEFTSSGGNKDIDYEGKGTILTYDGGSGGGDVNMEISVKTTSFPHTNLIGLMAEDDFIIGVNSQRELMGGFYAQDTILANKQTIIVGTIVGDYFDLGTNVPEIYQIPELPQAWNAAMRMIGSDPVMELSPVSWRELGVR